MGPLIPMITRVGAMLMAKQFAKKKLMKKFSQDKKIQQQMKQTGKKAENKEKIKKYKEKAKKIGKKILRKVEKFDMSIRKRLMPKEDYEGMKKIMKTSEKEYRAIKKKNKGIKKGVASGKLKGKLSSKQVAYRKKLRDDAKKYRN